MSAHDQITHAISAHGMWKSRLKEAVQTGKSDHSPSTVATDDQCDFGKWLKASGPEIKNSKHFKKCADLHSQFHKVAGNVLSLALGGKKTEASKAIDTGSEFAKISAALVSELMAWDKEAS